MRNLLQIEVGPMAWDKHDGWCIEIRLFGMVLQIGIGL